VPPPRPGRADPREAVAAAGGRGRRLGALRLGPQQLDFHAELADPLHGRGELAVGGVGLALLQRAVERGLGLLAPLLELERRQAELAGEQFGRLAAQQAQDGLALAPDAPTLAGRERA
jgi:hypothetical protein